MASVCLVFSHHTFPVNTEATRFGGENRGSSGNEVGGRGEGSTHLPERIRVSVQ